MNNMQRDRRLSDLMADESMKLVFAMSENGKQTSSQ